MQTVFFFPCGTMSGSWETSLQAAIALSNLAYTYVHTYRGKCGKCPAKVLLILQRALAVLSIKRAGPLFGNSIKCRLMSQVTLYIGLSLVIMEHTDRLTKIPRLSSAVCAFMLSTNYPPPPTPPPPWYLTWGIGSVLVSSSTILMVTVPWMKISTLRILMP